MSEFDAKPSKTQQDRKSGGGAKRPARGHDVGDALRAAYNTTLKEDIPPDLIALLGKLD